ncbi:MFS transporter [Comamonadaceae bacterium G21597-S1]|nr:MFS transporter [Comamonadaceae bacterium G21597-S1]
MPAARFSDLTGQRAFMRFWVARLFGTTGNQMLMVAIGWQMYDITGSAWDLGLVGLYQFVPALMFTLVAGHVADRYHRGRIVAGCMVAQALVAALLVAATTGLGMERAWVSREWLLAVSVVLGMARSFQMPAMQSLTPNLLPPALLSRGLAFSSAGTQAAVIGGPALGGLVFVAGAQAVYALCAASFGVGCALVLLLRYPHAARPGAASSLRTLLAGLGFVWHRKVLLGAVSLDLFAVLLGGATALLPMFAKDILMVGPWGLGLLRGAPAFGALLMSGVLTRWPLRRRVGRTLLLSVALFGACMMVFGLSTHFWLSMLALAVSGGADTVSVVVRQTLVQLDTPDAMRGRVSAVNSVFIGASNQLGEFESGVTAEWMGPVMSVLLGGIGTVLIAMAWTRLFPALAHRDRLDNG